MRLGVLGAADSWYLRDLVRAAGPRDTVQALSFRDLAAGVGLSAFTAQGGASPTIAQGNLVATSNEPDGRRGVPRLLSTFDALLVRAMPAGSLEQIVFRMDVLGRLAAAGVAIVNPPRAVEAAVDKFLATALLAQAQLPVPRTFCCQTVDEAMAVWGQLGGRAVLKPLFGAEGRGLTLVDDEGFAYRVFSHLALTGAVLYLQEFVQHGGWDVRVLVVGEQTFGMRRRSAGDWRTNLSRGGQGEPYDLSPETVHLARAAADAIGAPLAGVDLLPDGRGGWYVLEVNAAPGWRGLSAATRVDIAAQVWHLLRALAGRE